MPAFDLASPAPWTWDNTGGDDAFGVVSPEQTPDILTQSLRDSLNQVYPYTPTLPPAFPAYVRAQDNGPGDSVYAATSNHTQPYDNIMTGRMGVMSYPQMVQPMLQRYEAPEPYWHLLAYDQLVHASTVSMQQSAPGHQLTVSLRAPNINEGL